MPAALSGVRVWLSGSIPKEATPEESARLAAFTKTLAKAVFREGAQLVHGFHPSLMPPLLAAAREYREATGRRAPLRLFVSTFFRDKTTYGYPPYTLAELEVDCDLQQIPRAPTLDGSLEQLRDAMASQADVLVAIGGRWWNDDQSKAGVPAEFLLALARGIPSFLLGSLGGATAGYLQRHPEIVQNLRNGLDATANKALAERADPVGPLLEQMARLPLGRRETASGQRFRILCLDGGAIRGAFTAAVLARWEEMSKLRAADHFDLIAGTSTGGILGIGLGLGLSAQEIVDFYRKQGPIIFPMVGKLSKFWHGAVQTVANKFEASVLEQQLAIAFDRNGRKATLADSPHRLLITSYNLTSNDLRLYRTSHHPGVKGHDHLRAVVVARATSAAPTYFKPAPVDDAVAPHESVDGGIWANCPAVAAVGEAVSVLKIPLDRIDVLSVGTAAMAAHIGNPDVQGQAGWAAKAPDLFMNSQMDATLSYMRQLLGPDRFLRVDDERPRIQAMDNPDDLDFLINRGAKLGEDFAASVMQRFLNGVQAAPWRSIDVKIS
jgi:hypothetical protein